MRKKLLITLLCIMTIVSLSACGSKEKEILTNEVDLLTEQYEKEEKNSIEESTEKITKEVTEEITTAIEVEDAGKQEITVSQKQDLSDFLYVLTWTDHINKISSKEEFGTVFLLYSIGSNKREEIEKRYASTHAEEYSLYMTEEEAREYLKDSLGYGDVSRLWSWIGGGYVSYDGTRFKMFCPDTGDYWVNQPEIKEITWLSSEEILIKGVVQKGVEWNSTTLNLEVVMSVNPSSIWGGFQFVEVRKSECYILPNSDTEYLTRVDLEEYDAEYLRLARNEIYARHGYSFKDEVLQKYFEEQSWYTARKSEVPDSELNTYEIANRDLILSIENENK